jgi:hypothetical protein
MSHYPPASPFEDTLRRLAEFLHWLGKPVEAEAVFQLAKLVRVKNLSSPQQLAVFVTELETTCTL